MNNYSSRGFTCIRQCCLCTMVVYDACTFIEQSTGTHFVILCRQRSNLTYGTESE